MVFQQGLKNKKRNSAKKLILDLRNFQEKLQQKCPHCKKVSCLLNHHILVKSDYTKKFWLTLIFTSRFSSWCSVGKQNALHHKIHVKNSVQCLRKQEADTTCICSPYKWYHDNVIQIKDDDKVDFWHLCTISSVVQPDLYEKALPQKYWTFPTLFSLCDEMH